MKRRISTLSGAVVAAVIFSSAALAGTTSSSVTHVYLNVGPTVTVGVLDSNLQLPAVQVGTTTADLGFHVDANVESLSLGVAVTELYKGDDPTNLDVAPLKVDQSIGATITAVHANPTHGASNVAQYDPTATSYNGYVAFRTNDITFESSQNGRFSQDVNVHVGWTQSNPEQPQGEYSGYVVLYAALLGTD